MKGYDDWVIASFYVDLREVRAVHPNLGQFTVTARYYSNSTDWGIAYLYTNRIDGITGDTSRPVAVYGR